MGTSAEPKVFDIPSRHRRRWSTRTVIELTDNDIRWEKLPLASAITLFPADSVGGSNRSRTAGRKITFETDFGLTIVCDIDGTKKMPRARAAFGGYYRSAGAKGGDFVLIEQRSSYRYRVKLLRTVVT